MIAFENLVKYSGEETHIYKTNLQLKPGTLNVLLGPTRAGKTTMLRLLAGLESHDEGRVLVGGEEIRNVPIQKRDLAIVYQQFINYPTMTVFENIAAPLLNRKRNKKRYRKRNKMDPDTKRKVEQYAELLRIENLLDRLPGQLSGGQQQRLAIARALAKEAGLLLLDEPLAGLDYKLREELRSELKNILKDGKITAVYSTTEPAEALLLGGETIIMDKGRVLQSGPALDVYHRPSNLEAGRLFSEPPMNIFPVAVTDQKVVLKNARFSFPLEDYMKDLKKGSYQFGLRANFARLESHSERGVPLNGKVEMTELNGAETLIYVHAADMTFVLHELGTHFLEPNSEIEFYLNPEKMFAFKENGDLALAYPREQI